MPELPEVETVCRGLRQRALGRWITGVEILHSGVVLGATEDFTRWICGRKVSRVKRKGKVLAVELESPNGQSTHFLMMRLGMTGQITVRRRSERLEAHTHVRLLLDDGEEEIRFRDARRFGRLRVSTREELDAILAALGPDAQEMRGTEFLQAARGRRGAVKSWLLNQRVVSGLGNIYADESLYAARIHPLAQPGRLSRRTLQRLYLTVKKVLKRAIELQGTSFRDYVDIEGHAGRYRRWLNVYGRTGKPCRRCQGLIRRIIVSGRSSHYCPRCQKRPRYITLEIHPEDSGPPSRTGMRV
jgi:formamidopyrimidine-DNA glycosylase